MLCLSRQAKYLSRDSQQTLRADFFVRSGVDSGVVDEEKRPIVDDDDDDDDDGGY